MNKENAAEISECGKYRYLLSRAAEVDKPEHGTAVFIMLNPSTADAIHDDATIRRCRAFAKRWGCNGILVANLYAFRATNPAQLSAANDPVGPDNRQWLERAALEHYNVICAWGADAKAERVRDVVEIFEGMGTRLWCLGTTKNGSPRHPLYVRGDQMPVHWEMPKK